MPPDTSDLAELPEGWVWLLFDQALTSLEGGTSVTATDNPSCRRVLRSSAVRHGTIDLSDVRYLPDDAHQNPDTYITTGDLLFTRLSGSLEYVGNCVVVPELGKQRFEFPDRIFRGRTVTSISRPFIQLCFANKTLRQPLEAKAKSTAGHQRISLTDLRAFQLPLPPLAEQYRIVAEVERRLSVIQQAEAMVEANLKRAERLRQSILKQAFAGQLVPQDPNDEPASVLLERIRAEREAALAAQAAAKPQDSPGAEGLNNRSKLSLHYRRKSRDHRRHRGPETLELLQRAEGCRSLLRGLPGAVDLPHLPQDDARAPAFHPIPCCPTISRHPSPRATTGPA